MRFCNRNDQSAIQSAIASIWIGYLDTTSREKSVKFVSVSLSGYKLALRVREPNLLQSGADGAREKGDQGGHDTRIGPAADIVDPSANATHPVARGAGAGAVAVAVAVASR